MRFDRHTDECRVGVSATHAQGRASIVRAVLSAVWLFALGVFSLAEAQSASFRSVDTNSDRVLSFNELVAAFGREGALRLLGTMDRNGDNQVTLRELRQGARRDGGKDERPDPGNERDDDDRDDVDRDDGGGDDDSGGGDDDGGEDD